MQYVHHLSVGWPGNPIRVELESLGFQFNDEFAVLVIGEEDDKWTEVSRLATQFSLSDIVTSEFSSKEIRAANFLRLTCNWHHGYPQPEDEYAYRYTTYDPTYYCERCARGLVQRAPFRLCAEPKWGRKSVMRLNWVEDEYFVRPEVMGAVFKPFGIRCRDVYSDKEKKLESVVQLEIPQTEISHFMGSHPHVVCDVCGEIKYEGVQNGFFPALCEDCDLPIFKTIEYFGSNLQAYRAVVISQSLCNAIQESGIRGFSFVPLGNRE